MLGDLQICHLELTLLESELDVYKHLGQNWMIFPQRD